jgi:trehalose 6-phosphate phosphatase
MQPLPLAVPDHSWAYFFDIDGTLVDLATSPGRVRIDRTLRQFLEGLHTSTGGAVALLTGRSISDVDRLFPGIRFPAAGQHGIERRDATGGISRHPFPSEQLDEARRTMAGAVARHSGLLLEDKGLSLALHYRMAPRLGGYAHKLARSLGNRLGNEYCVQPGKRVVEIRPAGKDKGIAIQEFMEELPFRGRTPVFLGDDATDEHGFAMVNQLGGLSVKVGTGATAASWRVPDVTAARAWLEHGQPLPKPAS